MLGLVRAEHLNCMAASVLNFNALACRWEVRAKSGEKLGVRVANMALDGSVDVDFLRQAWAEHLGHAEPQQAEAQPAQVARSGAAGRAQHDLDDSQADPAEQEEEEW